jgi:ATP-dependent 26S proteasome regulatory subunit
VSARPGRVDQAIEIGLPDAAARAHLIDLYVAESLTVDARDAVVAGTDRFVGSSRTSPAGQRSPALAAGSQ